MIDDALGLPPRLQVLLLSALWLFTLLTLIVARTRAELLAAIEASPFLAQGADPKTLHLAFLADRPSAAQLAALDRARSPGDAVIVRERDIHLHLPNGVGRTKLSNAYFDAKLGTISTMRNLAHRPRAGRAGGCLNQQSRRRVHGTLRESRAHKPTRRSRSVSLEQAGHRGLRRGALLLSLSCCRGLVCAQLSRR